MNPLDGCECWCAVESTDAVIVQAYREWVRRKDEGK